MLPLFLIHFKVKYLIYQKQSLKGILLSTLLVLSMSLNLTLNATELEELKACENITKAESVKEDIPLENFSFDTMFDNAKIMGYCMGLNMRQGFTDAVGNYSHFIK